MNTYKMPVRLAQIYPWMKKHISLYFKAQPLPSDSLPAVPLLSQNSRNLASKSTAETIMAWCSRERLKEPAIPLEIQSIKFCLEGIQSNIKDAAIKVSSLEHRVNDLEHVKMSWSSGNEATSK